MASPSPTSSPSVPFLARWSSAFFIIAIVCGLAAAVLLGAFGSGAWWGVACAAIAIVALVLWIVGARQWQRMRGLAARDAWARQRALRGANALLSTLLLLALLLGINWLNARHPKVWDWTQNNRNSLSDQTQRVLKDWKFDVTMTYVYAGNAQQPAVSDALDLLRLYQAQTPHLKLQVLNAAADPQGAQALLNDTRPVLPMVLLQRTDAGETELSSAQKAQRRREVTVLNETNLTSAFLKLAAPKTRVLQMLTGHGEIPLWTGRADGAFNAIARDLGAQNYSVQPLSLAGNKAMTPKNVAAVLVIAPQSDLGESELQTLLKFWQNGGKFVFWLEPTTQKFARWNQLLAALGVTWPAGVVFDPERALDSPQIVRGVLEDARLGTTERHPILRGVNGDIVLPGAAPLGVTRTPIARALKLLFASSPRSYARAEAVATSSPQSAAPPQQSGPFLLSGASENPNGARAVVVASALFAADRYVGAFGNRSFALAGINWVAGDELLVSIPARAPVVNNLSMPDEIKRLSLWLSLFALPLGCLLLGAFVWWKRR